MRCGAIAVVFLLCGCYLSTECDSRRVAGFVAYLGGSCDDELRELVTAREVAEERELLEALRLLGCGYAEDTAPRELEPREGFELFFVEGYAFTAPVHGFRPHQADRRAYDRYRHLEITDASTDEVLCVERWGVVYRRAPDDGVDHE